CAPDDDRWRRGARSRSAHSAASRLARRMPPPASSRPCALPQQLESELQLPWIVGRRDRAETTLAAVEVRRPQVGVVEQIERLEPELEPCRSDQRERLRRREVELPE